MRPHDVTPKRNSDTTEHDFARRYPIITAHFGLPENLGWERYRVSVFKHELEHTARSWLDRQRAYSEWTAAFLGDEDQAA